MNIDPEQNEILTETDDKVTWHKFIGIAVLTFIFLALLFLTRTALAYDPDIRATMSNNTTPSGYVVNENNCAYTSATPNANLYKDFDGSNTWDSTYILNACDLDYQLPAPKILTGYGIYQVDGCANFVVKGGNSLGSLNTLDTQTGQSISGGLHQYTISDTSTPYSIFTFRCTDGSYWTTSEIYYYGVDPPAGEGTTTASTTDFTSYGLWGSIVTSTSALISSNVSFYEIGLGLLIAFFLLFFLVVTLSKSFKYLLKR